jgi:hypothetical protein
MEGAPKGVRSFDELAKLCLKSTDWPSDSAMQHRSLGAILGRLDREEGLEWLTGRPAVQRALAGALGMEKGALLLALRPRQAAQDERRVTWAAMPLARGLDLVEEELFPGLPTEVLHPHLYDRLIWVAPSGSGRSLVGQWLTARGLGAHRSLARVDPANVPRERPLLLELGSAEGLTEDVLLSGICVAVPEPWEPPAGFGPCTVVRSPPVSELIEPLVRWACARFAERALLGPERLVSRIAQLAEQGLVASAGDVLGLVGLADAEGQEALDEVTLERAATAWLKRRARERLDPETPEYGWVRRSGLRTLVALARTVTTDEGDPLFCPRPFDAWSELLPENARHGPDLEWLKAALPEVEPSVRVSALERATEKLPPGAFRALRAFEHLGLFARDGSDRLALRPHWLVRVTESLALGELVTGPAFDWGEALLSPRMAPATMERLITTARARALPLEELIEPSASADPGYAAAIEGAVRALGAAELFDVHVGGDALEPLWDEQLRLSVALADGLVAPRIEHTPVAARNGGFWLCRGAWYLSLLAFGEALDAHQGRKHALLRPWLATEPPVGISALLDAVAEALERPDAPRELWGPAVALVSRLGALLGPLGAHRERHPLERAATVADEAAVGVLAWSSVAELAGDRLGTVGLAHLVQSRRLDPALFGQQVWQAFETAGMPSDGADALLSPELAPLVLPTAPSAALHVLLPAFVKLAEPPQLSPSQWLALFGAELGAVPARFFRLIPAALVGAAVDPTCRAGHREGLAVLWTRATAELTRVLMEELLATRPTRARELLFETAPPGVTLEVLGRLPPASTLLRGPAASLTAVRRFLHGRVAARSPGFRDAYKLLDELEGRVAALRAQS